MSKSEGYDRGICMNAMRCIATRRRASLGEPEAKIVALMQAPRMTTAEANMSSPSELISTESPITIINVT